MMIFEEEMLLDEDYRKRVISEINGPENVERKLEAKKRYDILRDLTKHYVYNRLKKEFDKSGETNDDQSAIDDIVNRIANISFGRRIIEKKASVYNNGAIRQVFNLDGTLNEEETDKADKIYKKIRMNFNMKRNNQTVEAQNNSSVNVLPYKNQITQKYRYKLQVLHPHYYDAIEDSQDKETARVKIFSYFDESTNESVQTGIPESVAATHPTSIKSFQEGDRKNQIIADSPADESAENQLYIWWSTKYHFTTDVNGAIVAGKQEDNLKNPFQIITQSDFAKNQDGHYWAIGGSDVFDGSILLNILLTDLYYIAKYQGFGFFYAFAKDLPRQIKVGPREGITGSLEEGDPTPQIGFASPSSPLDQHMQMIKQYLVFLLSTKGLDAGAIASDDGDSMAKSGVHEAIKQSENSEDIVDSQAIYQDGERNLFEIVRKVHNVYLDRKQLDSDLALIGKLDESTFMSIKFQEPSVYQSDMDKLEIIEKRKELGIDSQIDAIMRDNQDLSREQAEEKFKRVLEEKLTESRKKVLGLVRGENESYLQNGAPNKDDEEQSGDEE